MSAQKKKLKYHLQMVVSRAVWRINSVEPVHNFYVTLKSVFFQITVSIDCKFVFNKLKDGLPRHTEYFIVSLTVFGYRQNRLRISYI